MAHIRVRAVQGLSLPSPLPGKTGERLPPGINRVADERLLALDPRQWAFLAQHVELLRDRGPGEALAAIRDGRPVVSWPLDLEACPTRGDALALVERCDNLEIVVGWQRTSTDDGIAEALRNRVKALAAGPTPIRGFGAGLDLHSAIRASLPADLRGSGGVQ